MVGIGKQTLMKRFIPLDDHDPIITSLIQMGKGDIAKDLVDDQLPEHVRPFEKFTCQAYSDSSTYLVTIPDLRWHLFRTKNLEGKNLPPPQLSLYLISPMSILSV